MNNGFNAHNAPGLLRTGPVRVVMGLLFDDRRRILIALRNKSKLYGGYWEFPGGKIEPPESVEHALKREIREELDAPIVINRVLPGYRFTYGSLSAEFIPIIGNIRPDDITLMEHDEHRFVAIEELDRFSLSPYDSTALTMLKDGLV